MELRQLEAFVTVAHEGSFTQAADKLNLTQPSLSARVQQLEQSLGAELLSRQTRPITLTATGRVFLPYAERVLSILDVGLDAVREAESGLAGRLRLGCPISVATYLMPQIMETFNRRYPHVALVMETGYSATMVEMLQDGLLDMTFTAVFPHLIRQCELLLHIHDELVPAVTAGHALSTAVDIPIRQLWQYRAILPRWGSSFEAYIHSLRDLHDHPHPLLNVPLATALPMIQQGRPDTIIFVPRRVAQAVGLMPLHVTNFTYSWDVALMMRSGRTLSPLEAEFVSMVQAAT